MQDLIIVDVVAATADRGLVVDVSETSKSIGAPVRVAITSSGDLLYDSRFTLTQQEIILSRLLGRDVIGATDHQVGDAWTIAEDKAGHQDAMSFRVLRMTKQNETVEVTARAADATNDPDAGAMMRGTVKYDPALSDPLSVSFAIFSHSDGWAASVKTQKTLGLSLVEDSFNKKKQAK